MSKYYYLRYQDDEELKFLKLLFDRHNIKPMGTALDAGCGYGFFTHLLAEAGYDEVTGFDFDGERISEAIKTYGANDGRCRFKVADATNPPFEKEKFDFVFCRGLSTFSTEDIPNGKKQFDRLYELLKPGGFFVFVWASDLSGKVTTGKIVNHKISTVKKFFESSAVGSKHWTYFIFAKRRSTKELGGSMFTKVASTLAVLLTLITKRQGYIAYVIRKTVA